MHSFGGLFGQLEVSLHHIPAPEADLSLSVLGADLHFWNIRQFQLKTKQAKDRFKYNLYSHLFQFVKK